MFRLRTLLLIWSGIIFTGGVSLACSCVEPKPPACEETWRAAAVFTGTVTQMETVKDEQENALLKVRLAVNERFVNLSSDIKEIDIFTAPSGPACGFYFERGHSYLVYADRMPNGALRSSHCTRTTAMENAAADLEYLRSLPTRKPVGEITGVAFDSQIPRRDGGTKLRWSTLPGVGITIHSEQLQKATTTDSNGRFVFSELPPDSYKVGAASSGYWAGSPVNVLVPSKGCADVPINLNVDRAITGRLLDQFGRTVPNVTVELVGPREFGYIESKSDAAGRYEFRRLMTGEYYLGVSLGSQPLPDHPYQPWYYPGVPDFAKALPLLLGQGPKVLTVDLPLPEPQHAVTVRGLVQWPDGRPAASVDVFPEDPDFPQQLEMIRFTTDENGTFEARLFDQTTYKLYAMKYEPSTRKSTSAEPVTITPGQLKEGTIVRLVLSHDGDLITPEMNRH